MLTRLRPFFRALLVGILGLLLLAPTAEAASGPKKLSKRAQLRYQDVLTTRDGSVWRGKLVERGDSYRIRLEDGNVVAVPQEDVATLTRELHEGFPHRGQWTVTGYAGLEVGYMLGGSATGGTKGGPTLQLAVGRNFGGSFEPEVAVAVCPVSEEPGQYTAQIAVGSRYYLQPYKRAKPFTSTQVVLQGSHGDLGLRTGPGVLFDLGPNLAIGAVQGVTLLVLPDLGLVGPGYHALGMVQGRF